MSLYQNKYRIESTRLKEWDYNNPWWYYVTINTKNHILYFGEVVIGKIDLNALGNLAENMWKQIPFHYKNVELDYFVIMPNHIHGIIILNESKDVACNVSTSEMGKLSPRKNSLSVIIRGYKSAVTKYAHENGINNFSWQSRYYDRIIRNEKELYEIRKYIEQNPMKWDLEKSLTENLII
jgi:putative transposase